MAKSKLAKTKALAWLHFSRYIRLRDCLITTGTKSFGDCVTCKRRFHYKQLQAGHCVPGRSNAILLDDIAVHAQCAACNAKNIGNGRHSEYALFIIDQYGRPELERIQRAARSVKPMKQWEWQAEYEKWKAKADGLEAL